MVLKLPALLVESGVVKNEKSGIKVLGNGSLDKKLTVKAHKFSASAAEAIDAKGGAHDDLMFQTFVRLQLKKYETRFSSL